MAQKTKKARNKGTKPTAKPTAKGTGKPEKAQTPEKPQPPREEPAPERKRIPVRPELIALTIAAFITRVWRLYVPDAVVFDEVHFKGFAAHYLDGKYFFDIHPPLAKLLLAGYAHLVGLSPAMMLKGAPVQMRVLPAVCGALLVPLVWAMLRRLGVGRPLAFLGGFLILVDNALLVESRFILMDTMLILFGLGAVYLYLIARSREGRARWIWLVLAALGAGAALSTKWTGLAALGVIGLCWIWDNWRSISKDRNRLIVEAAVLVLIPLLVYMSAFWVHFALLTRTGEGDAFMLPAFKSTLIGSPTYDPKVSMSFLSKFLQLNQVILSSNSGLTATHPYASRWYTWPLELRAIYYWAGAATPDGSQGNIYLLGNPVIWWGLWPALLGAIILWRVRRRKISQQGRFALGLTGLGYLMNLLPFVEVTRVLFLYHYFFSFIYGLMFVIILWDELIRQELDSKAARRADSPSGQPASRTVVLAVGAVALAAAIGFLFFLPLTYGTPLSTSGLQARMWLSSWR